jgi:hypothetical protein
VRPCMLMSACAADVPAGCNSAELISNEMSCRYAWCSLVLAVVTRTKAAVVLSNAPTLATSAVSQVGLQLQLHLGTRNRMCNPMATASPWQSHSLSS